MPPNFLIFMTDQQRAATVQPGHPLKAITPHFDRFREQSTLFTKAFCPSPHCCPSRATFFSGQYPSRHGVWNNVTVANSLSRGPRQGTSFWSRDLAAAGYDLKFSGKWHVSHMESAADFGWNVLYPAERQGEVAGDRESIDRRSREHEFQRLRDGKASSELLSERRPGEILRPGYREYIHYGENENPFGDADVVAHAIKALDGFAASGPNPWCLFVGTLGPHDPYIPPRNFLDWYPDLPPLPDSFADPMTDKPALYRRIRDVFDQLSEREHREALRHYLAFCSYEDYLFGQVLAALEASGQAENTVVIFLSDHGDYTAEHGLWCKGLPVFDPAYHIPAAVRMPGAKGGHEVHALVSLADFAPTILELAGLPTENYGFPGASLVPFLKGEVPDVWRDALFFQTNGNEIYANQRMIRTSRWKLVRNSFDYDELYDLQEDPDEMHNLLASACVSRGGSRVPEEYKTLVRELYRKMWTFNLDNDDAMLNEYIFTALAQYGPRVAFNVEKT